MSFRKIPMALPYRRIYVKIKGGLWYHLAVSVSVCLSMCLCVWPPDFLKAGILESEETAIVGRIVLYSVRVVSNESMRLVLPRIAWNIILPSRSRSSCWHLSFRFSEHNSLCTIFFSHPCYLPCPSHYALFHNSDYIWLGVQSYEAPHLAVFSSLLLFNPYSVQIFYWEPLFSKILSLHVCSPRNVRDQVSHPYNISCKILRYCLTIQE
jgi:hypothetical protein